MCYNGESQTILKFLGFLVDEYQMKYMFQTFNEYLGFHGPINTYSFYNQYGCFTLLQVVQRGEWSWHVSGKIDTNLYNLLQTEIKQKDFIQHSTMSYKKHLKLLADVIKEQVECSQRFFGITVKKK